jgi:hypothetical protein
VPDKGVGQRKTYCMDGARIERRLSRDTADSVSSKKLSHDLFVVSCTVLITTPFASRVINASPRATALLVRSSSPV